MNRELKFRAWVKDSEVMIDESDYQDFAMVCNGDGFGVCDKTEGNAWLPEYHFTIMQYTGLKDKNGKEIYEGDVMQADNWNPRVFLTEKITAPVVFMYGSFHLQTKAGLHLLYDTNSCEVIGNIYENPELLKQ